MAWREIFPQIVIGLNIWFSACSTVLRDGWASEKSKLEEASFWGMGTGVDIHVFLFPSSVSFPVYFLIQPGVSKCLLPCLLHHDGLYPVKPWTKISLPLIRLLLSGVVSKITKKLTNEGINEYKVEKQVRDDFKKLITWSSEWEGIRYHQLFLNIFFSYPVRIWLTKDMAQKWWPTEVHLFIKLLCQYCFLLKVIS